jgi:hypothetical protein
MRTVENVADASGATLVAALITATVALLITVMERVWIMRGERRADRRRVYARFLGACWEALSAELFLEGSPEVAIQRTEAVATGLAEVELVAPPAVQKVAGQLAVLALERERRDEFGSLRRKFLDAARRDLGERS